MCLNLNINDDGEFIEILKAYRKIPSKNSRLDDTFEDGVYAL